MGTTVVGGGGDGGGGAAVVVCTGELVLSTLKYRQNMDSSISRQYLIDRPGFKASRLNSVSPTILTSDNNGEPKLESRHWSSNRMINLPTLRGVMLILW